MRKQFRAERFSLNFRALTFSLNMKNLPDHIESVTYKDEVRCAMSHQTFFLQVLIFLKGEKVGQVSVLAETLD